MEQAAGSVVVQIGGNIAPFEAALAKARKLAESFDAQVSAKLSGSASAGMAKIATAVGQTNAMLEKLVASSADSNAALAKLNATAQATNDALAKLGSQSARAVSETMTSVNRSTSSGVVVMEKLNKAVNDNSKAFAVNRIGMMELRAAGINTFQALAAGMAPFQVAMMEGAQVVGAFVQGTEGGLKGLLGSIGARAGAAGLATLAAMATPIGAVTTAVLGASTAVLAYGVATRRTIVPLNDLIKQQADEIKSLGTAYGDAAKAAKNYAATAAGFGLASTATIDQLRISMADSVQRMGPSIGRLINPGKSAGGFFQVASEFAPFADAIKYLQKTARDGEPDILGFRQMVEQKWALSPNSKSLTEAAAKLEQMTADAAKAAEALRNLKAVQDQIISNKNAGPGGLGINLDPDAGSASRDKFLSDQSARVAQMRRDLDAELQSINARTVAQRAAAASAAILAGRGGTKDERQYQANAASQKVFAQATKEANDALIQSQEAMKTAGLTGYGQQVAQINVQLQRQIELNPENADAWRKVAAAQKQSLDIQTRMQLFRGQQDTLATLKAEASGVMLSDDAYRGLMTTVQAKIELEQKGISVTSAAGQAYVDNAKVISDYSATVKRIGDAWNEVKQGGGQAIDDLVNGLTDGTSKIRDVLKSVSNDLLKTFTQLGVSNPLKNLIFGQSLPTLGDLFSPTLKAPSLSIPGLGSLGSSTNPMYVIPITGIGGIPGVGGQSGGVLGWLGSLFGGGSAANSNVPLGAAAKAIQSIESGGNYSALGPLTSSGDRAYGAYQVMGANIPAWTKQALGYSMTPGQFLANPNAQDSVFSNIFGGYSQKYGMSGAAAAWFGGPGAVGHGSLSDMLGTTVNEYVQKFNSALGSAAKGLDTFGGGLGKFGQSLANAPASGGGGGLFGWIGKLFGFGGGISSGVMSQIAAAPGGLYANGGMFLNGISGFSNSIVSHPTLFKFASGTGLMGEAGPEGILPLRRNSRGQLGVIAANENGGSNVVHFAPVYNIDARGADQAAVTRMQKALDQHVQNHGKIVAADMRGPQVRKVRP